MSKKMKFKNMMKNVKEALNEDKVKEKTKESLKEKFSTPEGQQVIQKIAKSKIGKTILEKLDLNFTPEQWKEEHEQGTISENSCELDSIARNALKLNLEENKNYGKICYICCNTYERPDYSLGVGPMNDAITVASYMKDIGFDVYYSHNPKSQDFLKFLKYFYRCANDYLVVYYTGHGSSVRDRNGDEDDGFDECFVFDDGYIVDDDLAALLCKTEKKTNCKVLLLNDCCHSGSIYDLQSAPKQGLVVPRKVMTISAAMDKQTAKQKTVNSKDQGIFTFYFFKFLTMNPKITPSQMETQSRPYLSRYDQNFVAYSTTDGMLNQPIFD